MPQVRNITLPNRALSDLLREIGVEASYDCNGTEMTKNEILARALWDIVLNKEATLPKGTVVKFSSWEWIDVVWRIIERMDGKAPQSINATVTPGISLTRTPRFGNTADQEPANKPALPLDPGVSDPSQAGQSVIFATATLSLGAPANGMSEAQPLSNDGDVHD